jgi:hypothetical protein
MTTARAPAAGGEFGVRRTQCEEAEDGESGWAMFQQVPAPVITD